MAILHIRREYNGVVELNMLNSFDEIHIFLEEKDSYHTYVQNVDAGVYIIVAKELQIVR